MLDYYWEHGGDVDSYWISTEQFRKHCPRLRIPDDFGLYDGALLIAYDADHQVLTFNLVDDGSVEKRSSRANGSWRNAACPPSNGSLATRPPRRPLRRTPRRSAEE
ncbi:MAG TPA: hypothetical protein VI011_00515 [Asanoa sp.]